MLITVGEGGYGKVVKVKNKADPDKVFAAKKVYLAKRDVKTSVKKELEILQKLDSPHVIKFVEYFEDPKVAVWYKMSPGLTSAPVSELYPGDRVPARRGAVRESRGGRPHRGGLLRLHCSGGNTISILHVDTRSYLYLDKNI